MNTLDKVRQTIKKYALIEKGDRVLVALSGGSDSVAMLHILLKLRDEFGFSVCAAHLNHNIRKEADEDEAFVKKICSELGIECFTKSVNIKECAKQKSISEELCGREARYEFFKSLKDEKNINKIATAHNKNDSAESVLLHMIRGCGLEGLAGISPKREGYIIRPIIDITKDEVEDYCKENNLCYVVDKTNFKTDYTRNKIRLNLLPIIMEKINPGFIETVTQNGAIFKETADFLDSYCEKVYNKVCNNEKADIGKLFKEDLAVTRCIIQKMYSKYTKRSEKLSIKYVNAVMETAKDAKESKIINLPGGVCAVIEYKNLFFSDSFSKKLEFDYNIILGQSIDVLEADITVIIKEEEELLKSTKNKIYFCVDDAKKLHIRNRKNADIFMPRGMSGKKKLSDLFIDLKIPPSQRDLVPLLLDGDDIIWVMGIRQDRRFSEGKKVFSCEITKRRKD